MQTDLLAVEIGEKRSRAIQCQMTVAKLPLSKELEKFAFDAAQVDETLVRSLASSNALDRQRNAVLIGGTGKTHLAVRRGRKQLCEMMKRGSVACSDAWSCHKVSTAITAPSPARHRPSRRSVAGAE